MSPRAQHARQLTLERTFDASAQDVWDLWTTEDGIESWWGPDGFVVKVRRLDLRTGGGLGYTMTATGADQIDFMTKAGMPVSSEHSLTFTEVAPARRLAYDELVDFVPGVKTYEVRTDVEFTVLSEGGVKIVLTFDAMHDEHWTRLAVMGRESELERLAELVGRRRSES